ncbi:hypothetical protein [Nocardioides sp. SLBN-35]|uniref:hypothetical protein n=1 Tax=Nocardioides sp. SLBN-35 TaxID=2768445 RepID=UPI0011509786|nr:hypothetical protein [Nocardioides sp. SLBN-35]TQK73361.1 hypothetical protein FBY23_5193 [Nocardioides sp. SLBN-35]
MPRKTVLIYADGDFEKLAELRQRVGIAERNHESATRAPRRFGDEDTTATEVEEAHAAFDEGIDQAAERAEEWIVESIGFEQWRELLAAHPAREIQIGEGDQAETVVDPRDDDWFVNTDTFPKALLLWVDPEDGEHRTIQKAGDIDLGGLGRRLRRLSEGQFETLWATAWALNKGGISDPKALRFSTGTPRSTAT